MFLAPSVGTGLAVEKMCAWCQRESSWEQEARKAGDVDCQVSCDVVASHPLFAELFNEIGTKYPEFAALVPEITEVARAVVAAPRATATPAEKREEFLQSSS